MRILFSTGSSAHYMAPPQLSDEQVNCGPDWADCEIGGHHISLSTPIGEYDLGAVAARLPESQQPDMVVCLVDASWRALPRNLRAFRCPKVLLVADTHHLNTPLSGMIRYAKSEPFDRIVLLYDRHHSEFFRSAGLHELYWFPGLTSPHSDQAIRDSRVALDRRNRHLAFVGQTGNCHPRRLRMLSELNERNVPVAIKAISQRQSVEFYGSALAGFNASLNGDLNLRAFEIVASGAMLLTDRLSPAAGLTELWQEGREFVTYGSSGEMIERAQQAIANPSESYAIGAAGARWFDTHFNETVRRAAFAKLVFDGVEFPAFAMPPARTFSATGLAEPTQVRLRAGYEYVQELHRNLPAVVVGVDESVPREFSQMCETLPRVQVCPCTAGKTTRADFLVLGKSSLVTPSPIVAPHVWAWDTGEAGRVNLVRRFTSMGLMLADAAQLIFRRTNVNTHANRGAVALAMLEQACYEDAIIVANAELAKNPKSIDALIVIAEIALDAGSSEEGLPPLLRLRSLAPHHPRVRELLAGPYGRPQVRRAERMTRTARALFEQKQCKEAEVVAQGVLQIVPESAEAHFLVGKLATASGNFDVARMRIGEATRLAPSQANYWFEFGRTLARLTQPLDCMSALLVATELEPENITYQLALADAALAADHPIIAVEALENVERCWPGHAVAARWLPRAILQSQECDSALPRDLLISHVEVSHLQGTGVLIDRLFPDSSKFVTVRSRTLYNGRLNFGGIHFSMDLPGLSEASRGRLLRRLLRPFKIKRILAVPFFASDFVHAIAAHELTGAPLCTYVMDDQTVHVGGVPTALAQKLFSISRLRLAISPEMQTAYMDRFSCPFALLPPVVTSVEHATPNRWEQGSSVERRCAMAGNVWSAQILERVRVFVRATGLMVDWFGNTKAPWLPQDLRSLEADGLYARGFLPTEQALAERLAEYPFVIVPSGSLDGTEDNEWLTRLSLPSRIIFIVTQTQTPILVLGHADTAAAKFVNRFGLGSSSNYNSSEAQAVMGRFLDSSTRGQMVEQARDTASAYTFPTAGEWIWQSLEAGETSPTPFDDQFESTASRTLSTGPASPMSLALT
jgi:cytochrome c-type biogenesis protein CcmH/NrfG